MHLTSYMSKKFVYGAIKIRADLFNGKSMECVLIVEHEQLIFKSLEGPLLSTNDISTITVVVVPEMPFSFLMKTKDSKKRSDVICSVTDQRRRNKWLFVFNKLGIPIENRHGNAIRIDSESSAE